MSIKARIQKNQKVSQGFFLFVIFLVAVFLIIVGFFNIKNNLQERTLQTITSIGPPTPPLPQSIDISGTILEKGDNYITVVYRPNPLLPGQKLRVIFTPQTKFKRRSTQCLKEKACRIEEENFSSDSSLLHPYQPITVLGLKQGKTIIAKEIIIHE